MQRLYTRDEYMRRIEWMKNARRPMPSPPISSSASRRDGTGLRRELWSLLKHVEFDSIFGFKYSRRPNTPALALDDQIPEEEKTRRLIVVQELQREIQTRRKPNILEWSKSAWWKASTKPRPVDRPHFAAQDAQLDV